MSFFQKKYSGENISVGNFIKNYSDGLLNGQITVDDFLKYDAEGTEKSNLDRILFVYKEFEVDIYNSSGKKEPDYIKSGTYLLIPKDSVISEKLALFSQNQYLEQTDVNAFLGEYDELIQNDGYVRSSSVSFEGKGVDLKVINENIRVWVWIRAIDEIIDVSPFIISCSTNKSDVGNFSFSLTPISNIEDIDYINNDVLSLFNVNKTSTFGEEIHKLDFFEKNFQKNDVVFIRFEQLELEKKIDSDLENSSKLIIGKQDLCKSKTDKGVLENRIWDMIGLIDSVKVSFNSFNSDKTINVGGRDFMKLFVDDGSYFLPYKFIEGKDAKNKYVWGGDSNDNWFKRNMISGNYDYFFSYQMKPIIDSVKFIINHLSNLGVVKDSLFSSYGKDIASVYDVGDDDSYVSTKNVKGIWQIVKIMSDSILKDRRVAAMGLQNPDGTLLEFMNQICQKPFVEFWGDTFGNTFDLMVRQPPYTKSAIRDIWNNKKFIEISGGDLLNYNLDFDPTFYTSYQLQPQNSWAGVDKGTFESFIPIVYLPQYAEVFGNKKFVQQDIYLNASTLYGKDSGDKNINFFTAILNDYKFLIETTAYLPFTRKGSITLNGDRRIKKGMFVYLGVTRELFVVDSVVNSYSVGEKINRTTVITVSRGMKVDYINKEFLGYIDGKLSLKTNFSYFNIVEADIIINNIKKKLNIEGGVSTSQSSNIDTKFGVNEEVFNYFLERKHFTE